MRFTPSCRNGLSHTCRVDICHGFILTSEPLNEHKKSRIETVIVLDKW